MTRYFIQEIDGFQRIAAVTSEDESAFDAFLNFDETDAPPESWLVYERFSYHNATIEVFSENGE